MVDLRMEPGAEALHGRTSREPVDAEGIQSTVTNTAIQGSRGADRGEVFAEVQP